MNIRNYHELIQLNTFEDRLEYLRLRGNVGETTFGFDRVFNQMFYNSKEWRKVRNDIILRDRGCDLGLKEYEIPEGTKILIHHMNPISIDDIKNNTDFLLNPNYLITTTKSTHDFIHYGRDIFINKNIFTERTPHDTCLWKKGR
jgi:hypothetical protein